MNRGPFGEHEFGVLRRLVSRRAPHLLTVIDEIGKRTLSTQEQDALRLVVGGEFATSGLAIDSEPTPWGLSLEAIIDKLGRC